MYAILRQAAGVVIGGLIVAAITLAPRVSANDEITVASLQAPAIIDESSQTDKRMTYQGMLLDASGKPVPDGFYNMVFSIYNSSTGGTPLWSHEFKEDPNQNPPLNAVQVTNGLFTVLLPVGKNGDAETAIFTGQNLWLGVRVGNDAEATPRQPLLYVPYAFYARSADSMGGKGANYLPVAFGIVDSEGNVEKGTGNFSADWVEEKDNDPVDYYEISINNVSYNLNDFVTVVTPISQESCARPSISATNSSEGKLVVEIRNRDGNNGKCKFHFVTFKP